MTKPAAVDAAEARGAVTIGLVEDDPDQAALYAQWLTEAGYRVRRYGTAAEFRRRLGAERRRRCEDERGCREQRADADG